MRTNRPIDVPHPGWLLALLVLFLLTTCAGCAQSDRVRVCALQPIKQVNDVLYVYQKCVEVE